MSTKKKQGIDLNSFLRRRYDLGPVRDRFMMSIRMYRNLLVEREATEAQWGEIAGMINVMGVFANERKRSGKKPMQATAQRWVVALVNGATAMKEIAARNDRVGGRWVATDEEALHLTRAINIIDDEVLLAMAATDFLRIAIALNHMKEEKE